MLSNDPPKRWLIRSVCLFIFVQSNVILNQEKSSWRDMTREEKALWYDEVDRCIYDAHLQNHDIVHFDHIKNNICNSTGSFIDDRGKISLGYAIKEKRCILPMVDRPYLFKSQIEFSNPRTKRLLYALQNMALNGRVLAFLGDSVMGQSYESIFAEIIRLDAAATKFNKTTLNKTERQLFVEIETHGGNYSHIHFTVSNRNISILIFWIRCVYVHGGGNTHFSATGRWSSAQNILNIMTKLYSGVVLVANIGLWYNSRTLFNQEIPPVLLWLNQNFSKSPLSNNSIIWRETTPQHFDQAYNGYFRTGPRYKLHRYCIPHGTARIRLAGGGGGNNKDAADYKSDWRNQDLKRIFQEYNISNVAYLPIAAMMQPLHALHVTRPFIMRPPSSPISNSSASASAPNSMEADCTHYCWTPTLWQSTWHKIAEVVL